jgi:CheY-like chemotaxis protein
MAAGGNPIDIIFMDSQMTVVHGPEAATKIREMGFTGMLAAVSGNILDEDVQHFKACGADLFISKPLDLSKVNEVVAGK